MIRPTRPYSLKVFIFLVALNLMVSFTASSQTVAITEYPDWMYEKRMNTLNVNSPIFLEYNSFVRSYIDVYLVKRRDHFQNILNRSTYFFPIFEEYLDKYNLPLELKYLAVVESALDPKAKSSSGAMGLWQFMLNSGTMFDLEVTSFTDDRCDVRKSTEAACKYLQYLYTTFGDWQLALAAYNGGAGELQKAMQKSGKKNYWDVRPHLTEQMRGYVPAFMAVAYSMNYYSKHGFEKDLTSKSPYLDVDSMPLIKPSSLTKIASVLKIELSLLTALNPIYTKDYIPVSSLPVTIIIPKSSVSLFIQNEQLLYAQIYKNTLYKTYLAKNVNGSREKVKQYHTVEQGEYFHKIAMTYNCTIADIMSWNKLKTKNVYVGQKLVVYVPKKVDSNYFFAVSEVTNQDYDYIEGVDSKIHKVNVDDSSSEIF